MKVVQATLWHWLIFRGNSDSHSPRQDAQQLVERCCPARTDVEDLRPSYRHASEQTLDGLRDVPHAGEIARLLAVAVHDGHLATLERPDELRYKIGHCAF